MASTGEKNFLQLPFFSAKIGFLEVPRGYISEMCALLSLFRGQFGVMTDY